MISREWDEYLVKISSHRTQRVRDVRHLLLQAMMATAMADDHLADEETAALREVYGEVMRCSLDAAELAQVSEEMHSAGVQVCRMGRTLPEGQGQVHHQIGTTSRAPTQGFGCRVDALILAKPPALRPYVLLQCLKCRTHCAFRAAQAYGCCAWPLASLSAWDGFGGTRHAACIELHGHVQGFMGSLKAASQELDDIQRDMLIEATFKVAAADGIMKVSITFGCLSTMHEQIKTHWCPFESVVVMRVKSMARTSSIATSTHILPLCGFTAGLQVLHAESGDRCSGANRICAGHPGDHH